MPSSLPELTSRPPSRHDNAPIGAKESTSWIANASLFWDNRLTFFRTAGVVFVISVLFTLLLPKEYESRARIMPPEQGGSSAAMLAALVGKSSASSLAGLAGSLIGARNSSALFVALLHSGTVSGDLIDKFSLQSVYHKRYRDSTAKRLAHLTKITEDSKTGVITIVVTDENRERALDLAQAYLDELNKLVARVSTSSAHREREFIEQRLNTVQTELQRAQLELSDFSSKNTTVDLKEQTRATVDAGAKLEGQLIASESELTSLRQIYGDQNVRVRAAEARNVILERELRRATGQSNEGDESDTPDATHPYPALRELPRLGIHWVNLYRTVRVHETVYDLLSEEYETARINEAKSIPTLGIIDFPGLPERRSGPHRTLIVLISITLSVVMTAIFFLVKRFWLEMKESDPRRVLAIHIRQTMINKTNKQQKTYSS